MAGTSRAIGNLRSEVAGKMKGRLLDLSFTLNGKQRLVIELDDDFRKDFAA